MECGNCGDGSGWHAVRTIELKTNKPVFIWAACADCNDDMKKPKPELCEGCGETKPFCNCQDQQ